VSVSKSFRPRILGWRFAGLIEAGKFSTRIEFLKQAVALLNNKPGLEFSKRKQSNGLGMKDLIESARQLQDILERLELPFCFIGGLANLQWGEPRLTQDLDLTVLAGWGDEERVIDMLLENIIPRFEDARQFAINNRVLLLETEEGIPIDLALGALPFEKLAIDRSKDIDMGGIFLRLCSAEDLVVMKAFANRERDWSDIDGILIRQQGKMDITYIVEHIRLLDEAKPGEEIAHRLEGLLRF
jgi:predicted nucleotidyltransferase